MGLNPGGKRESPVLLAGACSERRHFFPQNWGKNRIWKEIPNLGIAYKRVRSSSGQSQNCVRLGTSRDKKRLFQVASSKFFDDRRVLRKKIAGTRIFT